MTTGTSSYTCGTLANQSHRHSGAEAMELIRMLPDEACSYSPVDSSAFGRNLTAMLSELLQ